MSAPPADRFTESVDWADGRVCTTGLLTAAAVDLLAGTTDQLRRAGHARITIELQGTDTPEEEDLSALRAVAEELGTHHCRLVVLREEKEHTL